MWDATINTAPWKKEFFKLSFGKAAAGMEQLWKEWESYSFSKPRENDLARWIDIISVAEKTETTPEVLKRFYQIKSYLHYLYLLRNYKSAKTESNLLTILSYGYRMLDYGSVSGYPAFFELGNTSGIAGMAWGPEAKWRINNKPLTSQEMNEAIRADRSKMVVSKPVRSFAFGQKFRNIPNLQKYAAVLADSAAADNAFWLGDEWVIEIKSKGKHNYIDFTGDYIGDNTITKPIKISIFNYQPEGNLTELTTPLLVHNYTARLKKEVISLASLKPGYYSILIQDPVKIYRLKFSNAVNYSLVMRPNMPLQSTSLNYAFIYVPEGVKIFNVIKSRVIQFITPTGRKVDLMKDGEEDIQVEVKENENGLWRIKLIADKLFVEGIPPFLGTSARQMLIPVAEK